MKYKQLNQSDRDRIEILLGRGFKQVEIAEVLGVHKSTISREKNRFKKKDGSYKACVAGHKATVRRSNSKHVGMKIEKHPMLKKHIIAELTNKRSPDEIAGRMKRERWKVRVGKDAIYGWLYSSRGQPYAKYLCTRRYKPKRQRKKTKREMIPNRISLYERPFGIGLVHAQGDTMLSPKKAKTTASVAVVAIENTKLIKAQKLRNLKPSSMKTAVNTIRDIVSFDTLTLDNGIENKDHEGFNTFTYFADPHSPWQKGLVEQSIGLLRRWFVPKGTDLSKVSEENLKGYVSILNNKYRKSLGYKNALEVSRELNIIN